MRQKEGNRCKIWGMTVVNNKSRSEWDGRKNYEQNTVVTHAQMHPFVRRRGNGSIPSKRLNCAWAEVPSLSHIVGMESWYYVNRVDIDLIKVEDWEDTQGTEGLTEGRCRCCTSIYGAFQTRGSLTTWGNVLVSGALGSFSLIIQQTVTGSIGAFIIRCAGRHLPNLTDVSISPTENSHHRQKS